MFAVACITAIISICIYWRQQKQLFFERYTERYQHIMEHLPEWVYDDADECNVDRLREENLTPFVRAYFDLCSEEYYLYTKKRIDSEVWREWEEGMRIAFNHKVFREYWEYTSIKSFAGYSQFREYIDNKILKK